MTNIHGSQVSLEAFDSNAQTISDVQAILEAQPDWANFTEATLKNHRDEVAATCKQHGYQLLGGKGDTAIALHRDHRLLGFVSHVAHSGGRDSAGVYGARTVEALTASMYGETVTVLGGHWLRRGTPKRDAKRAAMTKLACELVEHHSEGKRLTFLAGDFNEDCRDNGPAKRMLAAHGIRTLWDSIGEHPATGPGGGCIDWLASSTADTRVTPVWGWAWAERNSDHRAVSGIWRVRG